ncbi:MAG: NADP-dependent oxidoreductase [Sandaracinaceae bacterium]
MKAIRFHSFGPAAEVLRWEDAPDPSPGRGEVRVRVHAAALNPKDVLTRKGKLGPLVRGFPQRSGQDLAGVVDAVGKGVRALRPGERVFGMIGGMGAGACAELAVLRADELALAPRTVPLVEAAAVPLAGQTALQALRDRVRLRPGETVAINGASGGVGVFAIQIAKILGGRVVAVCSRRNEDFVRDLGADEVLPHDGASLVDRDRTFDAVFDVFGTAPFAKARRLLGPSGRYVTAIPRPDSVARGLASRFVPGLEAHLVLVRSRTRDLARLAQWIDEGKLRCVIERVYPIEDAARAHEHVETRRARGKVVLEVVPEDHA